MTTHDDTHGTPRPLSASDRRVIAWTIAAIIVGGYVIVQLVGLWTMKDEAPPSWLITAPAGATTVGEPRIDREPFRASTYVTVRPADGQKAHHLVADMGLSEQPTQIGPTPLDWRTVWVYSRPCRTVSSFGWCTCETRATPSRRETAGVAH